MPPLSWLRSRTRLSREVKDLEWLKLGRDDKLIGGRAQFDKIKLFYLGRWLTTFSQSLETLRFVELRSRYSIENRWDSHLRFSLIFKPFGPFQPRLRYCKWERFLSLDEIGPLRLAKERSRCFKLLKELKNFGIWLRLKSLGLRSKNVK